MKTFAVEKKNMAKKFGEIWLWWDIGRTMIAVREQPFSIIEDE